MITLHVDSSAVRTFGIPSFVYCILVSDYDVTSSGTLISRTYQADLKKVFPNIPIAVVRHAVEELEDMGYIETTGVKFVVGKNNKLFADMDSDTDTFKSADVVRKSLGALCNTNIRGVNPKVYYSAYMSLYDKPQLKVEEFCKFWECLYFSLFEDKPPVMSAKEKGQIGHLVKFFGTGNTLKNVMYEYLSNSEKYSKTYVSIGGLLTCRDKVYQNVKSITKSKPKYVDNDRF